MRLAISTGGRGTRASHGGGEALVSGKPHLGAAHLHRCVVELLQVADLDGASGTRLRRHRLLVACIQKVALDLAIQQQIRVIIRVEGARLTPYASLSAARRASVRLKNKLEDKFELSVPLLCLLRLLTFTPLLEGRPDDAPTLTSISTECACCCESCLCAFVKLD